MIGDLATLLVTWAAYLWIGVLLWSLSRAEVRPATRPTSRAWQWFALGMLAMLALVRFIIQVVQA